MIKSRKDYIEYLACDARALGYESSKPKWGGVSHAIYAYERLLRKCEYYNNCKKNIVYKPYRLYLKYMFRRKSIKYGFEIPLNCFGKGLSIAHIGPIIINGGAKIGDNCRIHVGVNIGTAAGFADKAPEIGNNVYIAPGAKVFGEIKIADGIVVGANAVVNKSFLTPDISIAGVPAKQINSKGTRSFGMTE